MTYAELRSWGSGDFPAERPRPDDETDFEVLVLALVGPPDQPGGEWFDF
jgi:hypothetical protein